VHSLVPVTLEVGESALKKNPPHHCVAGKSASIGTSCSTVMLATEHGSLSRICQIALTRTPSLHDCLGPRKSAPTPPSDVSIGSAVFAWLTSVINTQTDRQTDEWQHCLLPLL